MIDYIINNAFGCLVFQNGQSTQSPRTNLSYVKHLCIERLFTYEGYLKAVQHVFEKRYRIPLYLDETLMLVPTQRVRDHENIWINYASVVDLIVAEDQLTLIFSHEKKLMINLKIESFQSQIQLLNQIRKHKVKHFHF